MIHQIDLKKLKANPANQAIFEDFEPFGRDKWFYDSIKSHGVREAITVAADGLIIDGHRRYYAAVLLKHKTIPGVVVDDADDARVAFEAAQLSRHKTTYARVRLYYDRIADLVDRAKAKRAANVTGADVDDDLESEWEELEQVLAITRRSIQRVVRLIREIDAVREEDPARAERLLTTLRNHGVKPTLRLMGESDRAGDEDEPDLGTWERHNDPKTRPRKAKAAKPSGLDIEEPTISFDSAPETAERWQETVHRYCDKIEQLFVDNDAYGTQIKAPLTMLRNYAPLREQKAAA